MSNLVGSMGLTCTSEQSRRFACGGRVRVTTQRFPLAVEDAPRGLYHDCLRQESREDRISQP